MFLHIHGLFLPLNWSSRSHRCCCKSLGPTRSLGSICNTELRKSLSTFIAAPERSILKFIQDWIELLYGSPGSDQQRLWKRKSYYPPEVGPIWSQADLASPPRSLVTPYTLQSWGRWLQEACRLPHISESWNKRRAVISSKTFHQHYLTEYYSSAQTPEIGSTIPIASEEGFRNNYCPSSKSIFLATIFILVPETC